MTISTAELRSALHALLSHLEETGHGSVEIADDFYWDVPATLRYSTHTKPDDLTVGQLSDDWAEIRHVLNKEREAVGYGLVWLGAILRRVGEVSVG